MTNVLIRQAADAAMPGLCAVCGARPRAAGGQLSQCLACLRADVERDRLSRQAGARMWPLARAISTYALGAKGRTTPVFGFITAT